MSDATLFIFHISIAITIKMPVVMSDDEKLKTLATKELIEWLMMVSQVRVARFKFLGFFLGLS